MSLSFRPFCYAALTLSLALAEAGCAAPPPEVDGGPAPFAVAAAATGGRPSTDGAYRRTTIGRGASIHATNGVRVGADGRLYVASVLGRSVFVVDRERGDILDAIGPERGVESPDDLAFGPDGSLYWTSFLTGEVGKLTPEGEKVTVARLGAGANAIAFSPDGRLFVTRVFLADELWQLDPAGAAPPRLVASGLGGLNAMEFGPDGNLYGPLWFLGSVARVDVETGARTTVASGFATPSAVRFDPLGRLHVLDHSRGELVRVDLETGAKVSVSEAGVGADNFDFDAEGRAYVTNADDGSIVKARRHGPPSPLLHGGIIAPGGVAALPGEGGDTLYVADARAVRVLEGRTGRELDVVPVIFGVSPLGAPLTASADGQNVLLSSWFSRVVQVFDPSNEAVVETHHDFGAPVNAVRFQGDLLIADLERHAVVRKNAETGEITALASLPVPTGLAAGDGSLYAADWAGGRVFELYAGGAPVSPPRLVAAGLSRPEGMAVDRDGSLLVVETGTASLLRIDPASGGRHVVEGGLAVGLAGPAGLPPTYVFNGVAVGEKGDIYVTLDRDNRIAKLSPLDDCARP